jgi:hypothetical protein
VSVIAEVIEGETARLVLPLTEDGTALDGTGFTVSDLYVTGNDGTQVTTTGDFGWVTQSAGTVYYDPDADDFVASKSPYRVRVKLIDGSSKVRMYPNKAAAEIRVRPVR